MRIQLLDKHGEFFIPLKSLILIFRTECQPWMRCPEQIGTTQIFVPVRAL